MTETLSAPVEADAPANRKPLLLAGGLAAVLALGGGGYLLLGGGSSTPAADLAPIPHGVRHKALAPAAAAAKPAAAAKKALLPAAVTVPLGRDPFVALYVLPTGGGAGTTAGTATATTPTSTTTSTGTAATTGTTAATTTTQPTGTTTLATAPYALKLVSISKVTGSGRLYTFSVNGTTKSVLEGQRFGKYGEITVLGVTTRAPNDTATGAIIQVGDDEPFTMAIGEKVSVK